MSAWAAALALWLSAAPGAGVATRAPELDGAIAGRVCEDHDGDGRCGPGDPGVANVRIVLETGDEARTNLSGRYHLVRVGARVPDATEGGRLLFGRHRVAVDPRTLFGGARVSPASVTVEVPMGGLVEQDFVISPSPSRPRRTSRGPNRSRRKARWRARGSSVSCSPERSPPPPVCGWKASRWRWIREASTAPGRRCLPAPTSSPSR